MWESSFVCLIVLLLSERELKNFKYLSLEPRRSPDPQRIRKDPQKKMRIFADPRVDTLCFILHIICDSVE